MEKSKQPFRKSKQPFRKFKQRSFRRRFPRIAAGDRIDYRNLSLLNQFISEQGKILSRRVNKLTLKQQRLITIAIKQARILSLLPFLNNKNNNKLLFTRKKPIPKTTGPRTRTFKRAESIPRTTGPRTGKFKRAESVPRTTELRTRNQ